MSEKPKKSFVIIFVSGSLAVLLAVILFFFLGRGDSSQPETSQKTPQTVARGSQPVDNTRIKETYIPGKTYKTVIQTSIESRGSYANWGLTWDSNTIFIGEVVFYRDIESNDGNRLVVVQDFEAVKSLKLFTQVDNISLNLGTIGRTILDEVKSAVESTVDLTVAGAVELAAAAQGLPPGTSAMALDFLNKLKPLPDKAVRNWVADVERDAKAKLFTEIGTLNGKKCRIVYESGVGVTGIEPIGCTLTEKEYSLIKDTAMISDIYLMKDEKSNEGDTWEIRGADLPAVLDPSISASLTGTLTAQRGKDKNVGDRENHRAVIRLRSGVLDLLNRDDKSEIAARWAPRGEFEYSFKDRIITSGRLTGDLSLVTSSLDHIIFQMKNTVTPKYEVTYHCEIVE